MIIARVGYVEPELKQFIKWLENAANWFKRNTNVGMTEWKKVIY